MLRVSVASLEYVRVRVRAKKQGVVYNPTVSDVEFAFTGKGGLTAQTTWVPGVWETDGSDHYAMCLVGPGPNSAVELDTGNYKVWVRVVDNPEQPVKESGMLEVY